MASAEHRLKDYLCCVSRLRPVQGAALHEAVQAWRAGDPMARRLLQEGFLPEVLRWVLPYRSDRNAFQPLIEAGNRALIRALHEPQDLDSAALADWLQAQVCREVEAFLAARSPR